MPLHQSLTNSWDMSLRCDCAQWVELRRKEQAFKETLDKITEVQKLFFRNMLQIITWSQELFSKLRFLILTRYLGEQFILFKEESLKSLQQGYCTVGPPGQGFPRASPCIKKGHNKYICTVCPTLTRHGKHRYNESCFKKKLLRKEKDEKTLPRPLAPETAIASHCHDGHSPARLTIPRTKMNQWHGCTLQYFTQITAHSKLLKSLPGKFRKQSTAVHH